MLVGVPDHVLLAVDAQMPRQQEPLMTLIVVSMHISLYSRKNCCSGIEQRKYANTCASLLYSPAHNRLSSIYTSRYIYRYRYYYIYICMNINIYEYTYGYVYVYNYVFVKYLFLNEDLISLNAHCVLLSFPRCGELRATHLEVLGCCADAGPDQLAARGAIDSYLADCDNILFFHCNCIVHQFHLCVRYGLATVDNGLRVLHKRFPNQNPPCVKSYFGSLAKTTNTWRANAVAMAAEWSRQQKDSFDVAKGRKLPQHCLVGRFGSIDANEDFYLGLGQAKVIKVLNATLQHRLNAKPTRKRKQPPKEEEAQNPDAEQAQAEDLVDPLNETAEYRVKMSKWKEATIQSINCPVFWFIMAFCHFARAPLRHFYHWAMQAEKEVAAVVDISTGKAQEFMSEYDAAFRNLPVVVESLLDSSGCAELDISIQRYLRLLAQQIMMGECAQFARRIVHPFSKCPQSHRAHACSAGCARFQITM